MKSYFFIADLFDNITNQPSKDWRINLQSIQIDGIEKLTSDFTTEITPNFLDPVANYDYADCNDLNSCTIGNNSFNPFASSFGLTWETVNSYKRGAALGTITGSDYGIVNSIGLGIDKTFVQIDNGSGIGIVIKNGAFYMDIDFSKSFFMQIIVTGRLGESIDNDQYHTWEHDPNTCNFSYYVGTSENLYIKNETTQAFLSGEPDKGWVTPDCSQGIPYSCEGIRTRSIAPLYSKEPVGEPDRGFRECCYRNIVLADLNDAEPYRNDFSGFEYQRKLSTESIQWTLLDLKNGNSYPINNNDLGKFFDFGDLIDTPKLSYIIIEWRNVLALYGEGNYQIQYEISGIGTQTILSNTFILENFTTAKADKTIRIDSFMNGVLTRKNIDYRNSGFKTSLRFLGFFGNDQQEIKDTSVVYNQSKKQTQARTQIISKYVLQGNALPVCITEQFYNFHVLANKTLINDYNLSNHDYKYNQYPVKLSSVSNNVYTPNVRVAQINCEFEDRFLDNNKEVY